MPCGPGGHRGGRSRGGRSADLVQPGTVRAAERPGAVADRRQQPRRRLLGLADDVGRIRVTDLVLGELVLVHQQYLLTLPPSQDIQIQVDHGHLVFMRPLRRGRDVAVDIHVGWLSVERRRPPLAVGKEQYARLLQDDRRLAAALDAGARLAAKPDAVLVLAEVSRGLMPVQTAVVLGVRHTNITSRHWRTLCPLGPLARSSTQTEDARVNEAVRAPAVRASGCC